MMLHHMHAFLYWIPPYPTYQVKLTVPSDPMGPDTGLLELLIEEEERDHTLTPALHTIHYNTYVTSGVYITCMCVCMYICVCV